MSSLFITVKPVTIASSRMLRYGDTLNGRYLVERELGKGGIGAVYLAHDQQLLGKPVVIKLLLFETEQNAWFRKKFRQEIEALARIDHPGVIGILDAGEMTDGTAFLVMQYVEGMPLRAAIRPEGMEFERAAAMVRQMGQALSAAHDKGVYHRDLKPENIMLQVMHDGEEYIRLIDFGIATVKGSQMGSNRQTTEVAGTVAYMAPEQLMGKPVAASDIYAFGVIAYELLTGRRPFNPVSPYQLYELQRLGVKVKPADLRPALNEEAQRIILKALSFEPQNRPATAHEFGDKLARALVLSANPIKRPSYLEADLSQPERYTETLAAPRRSDHRISQNQPANPPMLTLQTARPNLGQLVPKTCDRTRQVTDFREFFVANLNRRPGQPQICFIPGEEGECHESLVERLVHKEIRPIVEKKWGVQRGVVTLRKPTWPYGLDLAEAQRELVRVLFWEFDPAYTEEDWSPEAFMRLASSMMNPLIVIQHSIHAARWNKCSGPLLEAYLSFWGKVGASQLAPQFLVFLNIIYPKSQSAGWWKSILASRRFNKRQTDAEIRGLVDLPMNVCPVLLLKDLEPPRQEEVRDWFSIHNIYSEKARQDWLERVFNAKESRVIEQRSMAEVEHELQAVIISAQQEMVRTKGYL